MNERRMILALICSGDANADRTSFNALKGIGEVIVIDNCYLDSQYRMFIEEAGVHSTVLKPRHQIPARYLSLFALNAVLNLYLPNSTHCILIESGARISIEEIEDLNEAINEISRLGIAFLLAPPGSPKIALFTKAALNCLQALGYLNNKQLPKKDFWDKLAVAMQSFGLQVVVSS